MALKKPRASIVVTVRWGTSPPLPATPARFGQPGQGIGQALTRTGPRCLSGLDALPSIPSA